MQPKSAITLSIRTTTLTHCPKLFLRSVTTTARLVDHSRQSKSFTYVTEQSIRMRPRGRFTKHLIKYASVHIALQLCH